MAVTRQQFLDYLATYGWGNADPIEGIDEALAAAELIVRRAASSDQAFLDTLVMDEAARHLALSQSGLPMKLSKDAAATVHDHNIRRKRNALGSSGGAF